MTETDSQAHRAEPASITMHLDPVMRLTARHMLASHTGTAPVTVLAEADATALVTARHRLQSGAGAPRITYSHLLIRILAQALRQHPRLNATFDGNGIRVFADINIGVAMALPNENLVVPVVHGADRLTPAEISVCLRDLQERARTGRLTTADVRGGTFTLSNAGMVAGVRWTTPLLNPPQCAILATGAIAERAVVRDGAVVTRSTLDLSVTFDHRALNGFAVAEFVGTLCGLIARPGLLLDLPDEPE